MDSREPDNKENSPLTREFVVLRLSQYEVGGSALDLAGQNLSGIDLSNLDLTQANLSQANLGWADLKGSKLNGANLSGSNLGWISLVEADLQGANLRGTDLSGADLSGANLCEAEFGGAFIYGADFSRARVTEEQKKVLETAQYVCLDNLEIVTTLTLSASATFEIAPPQFQDTQKVDKSRPSYRFRLTGSPLSVQSFATGLATLDRLYTKSWLIVQGRFAHVIEYNRTSDPRFSREANLVISSLSNRSEIELRLEPNSAPKEVELESLERTIFETIEVMMQSALSEQALLEAAAKLAFLLQPLTETATREMLIQILLPDLTDLAKIEGLAFVPLAPKPRRSSKKKSALVDH